MKIETLKMKEIKNWIDQLKSHEYSQAIEMLNQDARDSVKKMAITLIKRQTAYEKEVMRSQEMWSYEESYWSQRGYGALIGGVDEVGRGPLVGPVVTATVVFDRPIALLGVNDSKKLSEEKRDFLYDEIIKSCVSWSIGQVEADEIDVINILNATKKAMVESIHNLKRDDKILTPEYLLIDAVQLKDIEIPQLSMIKGDEKSFSIAAASIVAKVTRDRLLKQMDLEYPMYGWAKNKGYGTKEHVDAIRKHGPSPYHRVSFIKNFME